MLTASLTSNTSLSIKFPQVEVTEAHSHESTIAASQSDIDNESCEARLEADKIEKRDCWGQQDSRLREV